MSLPTCSVQYPSCGACHGETQYDGDSFYCEDCCLDYGDGEDSTEATFRDEEAEPCGNPCDNYFHGPHEICEGKGYDCRPCALPDGHTSPHWTNCELVDVQ